MNRSIISSWKAMSAALAAVAACACALLAVPGVAGVKTEEIKSVEDADEVFIQAGEVRDGKGLVIGPVTSQEQFDLFADEFGLNGTPLMAKDKDGGWTLNLKGCRGWERPSFAPRGKSDCAAFLRMGKGIVMITTFDGMKDESFKEGFNRELQMQNAGFAFRGVTFFNETGKRVHSLSRGKGRVEVAFENTCGGKVDVVAVLEVKGNDKLKGNAKHLAFAVTASSAEKGAFKAVIEDDFLAYGESHASLRIKETANGIDFTAKEWDYEWPEYFSLEMPKYRGLVSTARRETAVHLAARFDDARPETFAGRKAKIDIIAPDGARLASFEKTFGDSPVLAFDAPLAADAPDGAYKVAVESSDADGKKVTADGVFKVVPVREGQVFVDQDGVLLADGKPWYPFGIYHLAGKGDIEAAAAMGIDMAQLWSAPKENLECLQANGMRLVYETEAWGQVINTYVNGQGSILHSYPFESDAGFRKRAELVRSYPRAVAMYYTSDEGDPPVLRGIRHVRRYWEQLDPEDHPTYLVATRDPAMSGGADVIGVDCYPRSFGAKRPMTSISDLIVKFNEALPGRCVIAVPEAFGHTANHKESPEECKCMAYLSMVAGAKGVFWYCWWDGGNQGASNDAETRRTITEVTTEAKAFKLALLAPGGVMLKSDDGRVLARLCGDESTGRFLIAVNGSDDPSAGVIASPSLKGLKLEPLYDSPAAQPDANGRLAAPLAGAARAVWRVAR